MPETADGLGMALAAQGTAPCTLDPPFPLAAHAPLERIPLRDYQRDAVQLLAERMTALYKRMRGSCSIEQPAPDRSCCRTDICTSPQAPPRATLLVAVVQEQVTYTTSRFSGSTEPLPCAGVIAMMNVGATQTLTRHDAHD